MKYGYKPSYSVNHDRRQENVVLAFLFVCGLVGITLVMFNEHKASKTTNDIVYLPAPPPSSFAKAATSNENNTDASTPLGKGRLLATDLQPEAKQQFTFQLLDYTEGIPYQLDMGNGETRPFIRGQLKYTYNQPGDRKVTLYALISNTRQFINDYQFTVAPAIEVEDIAKAIDYGALKSETVADSRNERLNNPVE